jgi:hypothetical protein
MLSQDNDSSSSIIAKPYAFECISYPYYKLSPSEFEELLYEISLQEIEFGKGEFSKNFDSASWLNKPGDRGRDVLLFKAGKSCGVIQCKLSETNTKKFAKNECVKEIIKFALHVTMEKSLIHDINTFIYYFAVSSAFKEDAILFLEDFRNKVINEPEIDKWIRSVAEEFKKIDKKYDNNYEEVKTILAKLKIEGKDSVQIDAWLNRDYNKNILAKHFKVKEIHLGKSTFVSEIPIDEIQKNIKAASNFLFDYTNFFYGLPDSHIERKETDQLLNWIKEPLKEDESSLAVLVGAPGNGKSVVLKDLLGKLEEEKMLFLGIKADQYYSNNKESLEKELGLRDSSERLIRSLVDKYKTVVIVIDQLDALSQTLSANREYLTTYQTLIHQLLTIDGVRIIVSIRKFDLETDSDFTFLKKYKAFPLGKLSKDEVNSILNKLEPTPKIEELLYGLLISPYNLNAFIKIYNSSLNLNVLRSTVDLYKELWNQKIIKQTRFVDLANHKLKSFLYTIVLKMHEKQMIKVSLESFSDAFPKEIEYLSREGILSISHSSIQFFHQTFYDFVFAKQFCENDKSIFDYTRTKWQSIEIRSMIKMVFGFLRETKHDEYIKMLSRFLKNKGIRFHLQLLLIQILASEQNPTHNEYDFVRKRILKSEKIRDLFVESIQSNKWLSFIISEGLIDDLESVQQRTIDKVLKNVASKNLALILKNVGYIPYSDKKEKNSNLWRLLFLRMLPDGREIILDYLSENNFRDKPDLTRRVLWFLKIWDNPKAFQLYNQYIIEIDDKGFDSYQMMKGALIYEIEWVIEQFKKSIIKRINSFENDFLRVKMDFNHSDIELFNELYTHDANRAFNLNLEVVILLVEKSKYILSYSDGELILDHAFHDATFEDDHDYRFLFFKLAKELQFESKKVSTIFDDFIKTHFKSNYESIIRLIIFGLLANPEKHKDYIYSLLIDLQQRKLLNDDSSWHYFLRKLLGSSYSYFSQNQKKCVNKILLGIRYSGEYHFRVDSETGKKKVVLYYNYLLFKYLQSIPQSEITQLNELNTIYQECVRRYKSVSDNEPHQTIAHVIGSPLPKKAYDCMSLKQWEKSFLKYNGTELHDIGRMKGGITEHARAFEDEVKKRPHFFAQFIKEIIDNKEIDTKYIIQGLHGLKEVKYEFEFVRSVFSKLIQNREIKGYNITFLMYFVDYCIENKYMDNETFYFIVHIALDESSPSQIHNPKNIFADGIGSIKGSAVYRLIQIYYMPEYSERIFKTIETISDDCSDSIKAVILLRLAYLNNYNLYRSFEIFRKLIDTNNEELLKNSLWSAGYFTNEFFVEMIPYFEKLMLYESLHEDTSILLAVAWLKDIKDSKVLLDSLLWQSEKARLKMIYVAEVNLFQEDGGIIQKNCLKLFDRFLNDKTKEMSRAYSHMFLRLSPDKFEILLPWIKRYSKSSVCKNSSHYFFEYLFKLTGKYPIQCLNLMDNVNILKISDDEENGYNNDKILNVIVGAYHSLLKNKEKNKNQIIRSVRMFDLCLKDNKFRRYTEKVLELNDRE